MFRIHKERFRRRNSSVKVGWRKETVKLEYVQREKAISQVKELQQEFEDIQKNSGVDKPDKRKTVRVTSREEAAVLGRQTCVGVVT